MSPSLFDDLVKSGEMPKPLRINRRTVWDIHQLDECFDALFALDDALTPISSSADFNPDEHRDILTLEIAMPDQRHPDALRLMRLAEQEIARIATEVGPQEAAQAAVMAAVRSLSMQPCVRSRQPTTLQRARSCGCHSRSDPGPRSRPSWSASASSLRRSSPRSLATRPARRSHKRPQRPKKSIGPLPFLAPTGGGQPAVSAAPGVALLDGRVGA
jgi:hypothetical protein